MGFRFYKRVNLIPGLRMNLSRHGPSFSVGHRGAWFTVGPRGKRVTVGGLGTGLFYTTKNSTSTPFQAPPPSVLLTDGWPDRTASDLVGALVARHLYRCLHPSNATHQRTVGSLLRDIDLQALQILARRSI